MKEFVKNVLQIQINRILLPEYCFTHLLTFSKALKDYKFKTQFFQKPLIFVFFLKEKEWVWYFLKLNNGFDQCTLERDLNNRFIISLIFLS